MNRKRLRFWLCCLAAALVVSCETVPQKDAARIVEKRAASLPAQTRPTGRPEAVHADWELHWWPGAQVATRRPGSWGVDWDSHLAEFELSAVPASTRPTKPTAMHMELGGMLQWHDVPVQQNRPGGWEVRMDADLVAGPMAEEASGWAHARSYAVPEAKVAHSVEALPSLSGFGFDDILGEKDASLVGYTIGPGVGFAVISSGGVAVTQSFWLAPRLKVVGYYGHGLEGSVQQGLSPVGIGTSMSARDHVVGFRLSYEF